jgi:protocatechuate 3,4-dioxygenase beta subunit
MLLRYATSDGEGRYSFADVEGSGELLALAPGRYPVRPANAAGGEGLGTTLALAPSEGGPVEQDLVLRKGIAVRGRVIDDAGAGVADALVVARSNAANALGYVEGRLPFVATSGLGGGFTFEGLPPSLDWTFEARRPGLSGESEEPTRLVEAGPPPEVVLRLRRLSSLSGRVLLPVGDPAPGTWLQLRASGSEEIHRTIADASGRFTYEQLRPGRYSLQPSNAMGNRAGPALDQVLATGENVDVVVRLVSTSFADGVVVSADGKPLAKCNVQLVQVDPALGSLPARASARTDENGAFRVEGLEPGTYLVEIDGAATETTLAAGSTGVTVRAAAAVPRFIEGILLAPDGSPCPAATITLWAGNDQGWSGHPTEVAGGPFRIDRGLHLEPGMRTWLTVTQARGAAGTPLGAQPLRLEPIPAGRLTLQLLAGLEVAGKVVDEGGTGIAGATVSIHPTATTAPAAILEPPPRTASDGSFRVLGLPDGEVRVIVTVPSPWLAPAPLLARAGDREVRVRIGRGAEIRGRVVGPEGEPIEGFTVETDARRTVSDKDGSFVLGGLPADRAIALTAHAFASTVSSPYLRAHVRDVRAGGEPIEIRLRRGVFLSGHVTKSAGDPVKQGGVVAEVFWPGTTDRESYAEGRVDPADGSFRVGPVEPGRVRLFYEDLPGRFVSAPIDATAPAEGLRLVVSAATTPRGRVTGSQGKVQVWWNPLEGRMAWLPQSVRTDGSFVLRGVRDGPGLLYVAEQDGDGYALREGISPSSAIEVGLEPGASIEGHVEGVPSGERVRLQVSAIRGALAVWAPVREDGSFRIRALPPGDFALRVEMGRWKASGEASSGASGVLLIAKPR